MSNNSVSTNTPALSARRYLDAASIELSRAQNQLSSGLKAPDPSDDPSGSAITSILTSAISALTQASSNAIQASSLVQLATGTLKSTSDILTRLATLAAQANSDSIDDAARQMLDKEYQALVNQVDKNANITWGEIPLFTGGAGHTNGNSYIAYGAAQLNTSGTAGPGNIASITFNQFTMKSPPSSTSLSGSGPTYNGGTLSLTIGGKTFQATSLGANTLAANTSLTLTATDGSGDNFTITANGTGVGANLHTVLGTYITPLTLNIAPSMSVIGMSGAVYGSGGSKATSSAAVVSLIVGAQTFKIDMTAAGTIANGDSFILRDDDGNTITLNNSTGTGFANNVTGATNLATALNNFFTVGSILANSGNGNGTLAAGANGLQAVANAFAGTLDTTTGKTFGFIAGAVNDIRVAPNGGSYDVSIVVGNQKFITTTVPTDGGDLILTSVTDGNNKLVFNYAASTGAITDASSFETALEQLLGITAGSPASFTSASTLMANTQLTPGAATLPGNYAITYAVTGTTGIFKLTDGINSHTTSVTASGSMTESITFDNGMTLALSAFNGSQSVPQATYNVSPGTAVNMLFQIGQETNDILTMTFYGINTRALGLDGTSITTKDQAGIANSIVLFAQKAVNSMVAELGGKKSQLSQLQSNLQVSIENQLAAKATFSDAEITEALMDSQKYEAIIKMATATFQKTLERDANFSRMVETVLHK